MALSIQEINRKLLHVVSGICIPAGILYIPHFLNVSFSIPLLTLGVTLAVIVSVEYIRLTSRGFQRFFLLLFGSMLRKEEEKKLTGATYVIAASFFCLLLFYNDPAVASIVLCLFILGDAAAALVGLGIGRIRIGGKTLEGSCACFLLCLIFLLWIFPHVPLLLDSFGGRLPLTLNILLSLTITVLELFPLKISGKVVNDNLIVPIVSGIVFRILLRVF